MVSGWLLKIVIAIAVVGFLVIELGSPVWTRAQLDDVAHDIADEAAFDLKRTNDPAVTRAEAEKLASAKDVTLTAFEIRDAQHVYVTVYRQAKSYLLRRFDQTRDWYDISVKADALPPQT